VLAAFFSLLRGRVYLRKCLSEIAVCPWTFCEILLTQISFNLVPTTIWAVTSISRFNASGPCGFLFFWNSFALHRTVTRRPLTCIANHPLTAKEEVYVFVRPAGASQAAPYGWHEPVCSACQPGSAGHIRRSRTPQAFRYSHAHQACHRDHGRKIEPSITCSPPISRSVEKPSRAVAIVPSLE